MADAASVAVAKAVEAYLRSQTYSQPIDPVRSYGDFDIQLRDLNTLRVDIVVVSDDIRTELAARSGIAYSVPVEVLVRKRFAGADIDDDKGDIDVAEIDKLVLLTEEIHDALTGERLTGFSPQAVWTETALVVNGDRMFLRENRLFLGLVRATFEIDKGKDV